VTGARTRGENISEHVEHDDGTPNGEVRRSASRLERRLSALEGHPRPPEPISVLRLLNTEEIRQALALIERAGVLPSGEVRHPEAFREAPPEQLEALEHWRQLCGEPLDYLELAEELLDRVGEARGWRSPESLETAQLLKRLESPDESPWYVGKTAEAIVALYAEMEEHGVVRRGASMHPHVRGAVRRLERLKEMDRTAPESEATREKEDTLEAVEVPQRSEEKQERAKPPSDTEGAHGPPEHPPAEEQPQRRRSWWREYFGFD
jgi:hypothetical protein